MVSECAVIMKWNDAISNFHDFLTESVFSALQKTLDHNTGEGTAVQILKLESLPLTCYSSFFQW